MAEKRQYTFASPELHWLNNPLGSSYSRMMGNLFSISANKDNEKPQLVEHGNSSKPSPHLPESHVGSPNWKPKTELTWLLISLASVTTVAPIERVYMLMQCQNEMIKAGRLSTPYKGMEDCFRRTIKREGKISLWRGNSVNVLKHCYIQAFALVVGSYMDKKMIEQSSLWVLPIVLTPFFLSYPLEYAHVRLATDVKSDAPSKFSRQFSKNKMGKRQFFDLSDVYKKTLRLDGIHGLYRGVSVACIDRLALTMASSSIEKHDQEEATSLTLMVCASTMLVLHYPCLTVSRRMMMTSGEASKYRGAMDAFYQIVKTEGVSSLFKGVIPCMLHDFARLRAQFGFFAMAILVLNPSSK